MGNKKRGVQIVKFAGDLIYLLSKTRVSLRNRAAILFDMNSHTIVSIPVLSGEVFETLPEPIRFYIRYLESRIQQLETRVH